jgi:exopolysaccharide biosynthesis predicted pyruvyltransferase EpsI
MNSDLFALCSQHLRDAFSPLVTRGRAVALVDFPDSMNCGDHAIWLGEKTLISELGGKLVYQCSAQTYDRAEMAQRLGQGAILFHGPANPGRSAQSRGFRLRVRNDFPDNEAIAFPRQAGIGKDEELPRTTRVEPAPDPTLMLGPRKRLIDPVYDVVWIARTDGDKANAQTEVAARLSSQAAEKFSIPGFADGIEMSFVAKHRPPTIVLTDWQALVFDNQQARWALKRLDFDPWAEVLLSRAMYILSLGHVVITDRLHGHLLCLMLRVPHVLLNDDSGKNWTFHEKWTKATALCRLARDPSEAWSLARSAAAKLKELSPPDAEGWSWEGLAADTAAAGAGSHP